MIATSGSGSIYHGEDSARTLAGRWRSGDLFVVRGTGEIYAWTDGAWVQVSAGTGSVTSSTLLEYVKIASPTYTYVAYDDDHELVDIDAIVSVSVAGKTVTLPAAAGITGRIYTIKATQATGIITLACTGAETIDGVATKLLDPGDCLQVVSNGADWEIVSGAEVAVRYVRHIQIAAVVDGTPSSQPAAVDFFTAGGLQFSASLAKFAFCQWEIPDDWDGTDIYFEVDWFPDSASMSGTDAVRWTVEYRAVAEGELINQGTSVTLDNGAGGDTGDHARYKTVHSRMTLAYNNANQPLTVQDHVFFKISRDVGVSGDFSGTVTVSAFEIIYTSTGFPTN